MLKTAKRYLKERAINAYALAEYRAGRIETARLQPSNGMNNVYSVSKTVTATVIGMLRRRGSLSIEDRAALYLDGSFPAARDAQWERITIGNLLSHTWGQERGDLFEGQRSGMETQDWLGYVLSQKLPLRIGEEMRYSNASYYLLSMIVERIAGRTLGDFIRAELASPMDWHGFAAGTCPMGHTIGASEFFMTVTDMAKLGALWLQNGVYEGRRYFDEDWAELAAAPKAADGKRCYGYSIWRGAADSAIYYGDGAHGQLIAVYPAKGSVLAMQAYDDFDMQAFVDRIEADEA